MKREDVKVDGTYLAKVNGGVVPVRITGEKWTGDRHTGWVGVNTRTNRSVRIKSAASLRGEVQGARGGEGAEQATADHAGVGAPDPATEAPAKGAAAAGKKGGKGAKAPKQPKGAKEPKPKKTSALDAAATVLAESGAPMKPKDIIALMESKGLWTSPGGKTPEATLYAAIIREIAAKGKEARFRKTERGSFVATGAASAAGKEG